MIDEISIQRINNGFIVRVSEAFHPGVRNYFPTLGEALANASEASAEDLAKEADQEPPADPAHNFLRGNKS
jgi:hypothetical protein